jgi:hypothetical protein
LAKKLKSCRAAVVHQEFIRLSFLCYAKRTANTSTSTRLSSTTSQQSSSEINYPRPAVSVAVRCSIDDNAHYLLVKQGKAPIKDKQMVLSRRQSRARRNRSARRATRVARRDAICATPRLGLVSRDHCHGRFHSIEQRWICCLSFFDCHLFSELRDIWIIAYALFIRARIQRA